MKGQNKNHRAEEYNNWIEKFNRVVQHQTKLRRRKDQWTKAMGNEKKMEKNEKIKNKRNLWNTIKWINTHIIGVPERKKFKKRTESLFKQMIAKNFPNLGKETDLQVLGS